MFLDLTLLSPDAIGDVEDVDTVAGGGNKDAAVFKNDPDNNNDSDDDEDDKKNDDADCESNDAVANIAMVVVDKMLPD